MKIRTKLLTAVLATATALSCALTASALTTTLNLQGNESTPATLKKAEGAEEATAEATLTLKSSDFENVKGAKIKVTLGENITFADENVTITDANNTWVKNSNFAVSADNKTITLVNVFNMAGATAVNDLELTFKFNVKATAMGSYDVTVSGDFADDAADKVYPVTAYANLVIGREETTATNLKALNDSIANANDYFIPYGGAYIGTKNLLKDKEGKFSIDDDTTGKIGVLKCKLPVGEAVTTFGVSKGLENLNADGKTAIQFGTYVNDVNPDYTYGTLFIAPGNVSFEEAIDYYKGKGYDTEAKILGRFIEILTTNSAEANTLHTIKFNNKNSYIKVAYVPQFNYMWKDSARDEQCNKLQYAVRYKIADTDDAKAVVYTAAGYYRNAEGTYNFSTEIKSSSYNDIPNVQ